MGCRLHSELIEVQKDFIQRKPTALKGLKNADFVAISAIFSNWTPYTLILTVFDFEIRAFIYHQKWISTHKDILIQPSPGKCQKAKNKSAVKGQYAERLRSGSP